MQPCFIGYSRINPAILLPQGSDVIVVPAKLLSKRPWETMRCVDSLRVRIVIAKHRKYRAPNVLLEQIIHTKLSIFSIRTRKLILRVVGDEVSSVNCPCNRRIAVCSGQRRDRLKSSQAKVIRRAAIVSSVSAQPL